MPYIPLTPTVLPYRPTWAYSYIASCARPG